MPNCKECTKPVLSGLVVDCECYDKLKTSARGLKYICPVCQNEEYPADAKYCKICGTKIKEEI